MSAGVDFVDFVDFADSGNSFEQKNNLGIWYRPSPESARLN